MALVAYDYSDSSDVEEDENATVVTLNNKTQSLPEPLIKKEDTENNEDEEIPLEFDQTNTSHSLFNKLPEPSKKKQAVIEEDDEFLHKKETQASGVKPKAKITVPSLHDFKDVEGTIPSTKPKVSNGKKSGLLSMLPQPRNAALTSKSFVPHVLTQKPATVKKKEILPSPAMVKQDANSLSKSNIDDSDEDEEIQNDFFSIHKTEEIPIDVPDIDVKPNTSKATSAPKTKEEILQSYFKPEEPIQEPTDLGGPSEQYEGSHAYTSDYGVGSEPQNTTVNEGVLDEEAIRQLCGARGKRKREEIQIVDVNQQEVLADAREWLLKGLMDDTTKRVSSSKRRGDEPTSQQRRKHQITYLAHQAKANEAELQNQWANNRMSKRQTQSKYGF